MTETVAGVLVAVIFFVAPCKAPPAGAGIQAIVGTRTLLFKHFGLFGE